MRKSILFLAAFAAIALVSCVKEAEYSSPESKIVTVNFQTVETKTTFGTPNGDSYPTLWTKNDTHVGVSLNLGDQISAAVTPSDDYTSATFKAIYEDTPSGNSFTFVVFNPNSAVRSINATNKTLNIDFPSGQTSTTTSPDESAQIIYAVSETFDSFPENVDLVFKHITAYLHLNFTNVALGDAKVNAVNITSSKKICGRWFFKLTDQTLEENGNAGGYSIGIATESLESIWCGLLPVDLSASTLKFVIATDKGTLTKTISIPENKTLTSGKIAKLTVDMAGVPLVSPKVFKKISSANELKTGDQIIIVSAPDDLEKALGTTQNGNNRSAADISKTGDKILDPAETVQFLTLEDGTVAGSFAFYTGSKYLYAAGGGNYLRSQDRVDAAASWIVSIDGDGKQMVKSQADGITENELRYNNNTNKDGTVNNLFSAYTSTSSCKLVDVYRLDEETPVMFNLRMFGEPEVSAKTSSYDFRLVSNVSWTASVTNGATLSASSGDGCANLKVSFSANTDTQNTKSYTVTISTSTPGESINPLTFTIVQAAADASAGNYEWVEITDVSAVEEADYVIAWTVSGTPDTYYYLPNDKTADKNPKSATGLTVSSGKITNDELEDNMIWNFIGDNSNGFTVTNGTNYLYATNTAQGIKIAASDAGGKWKVSKDDTYGIVMNCVDVGTRWLALYTTNKDWRYYNGSNYTGNLHLFKKTKVSN